MTYPDKRDKRSAIRKHFNHLAIPIHAFYEWFQAFEILQTSLCVLFLLQLPNALFDVLQCRALEIF